MPEVTSEHERTLHVHDVGSVGGVVVPQQFQHFDFHRTLVVEASFVPNDFQGYEFSALVVNALADLADTAPAEHFEYLESVSHVVACLKSVVASFVVEVLQSSSSKFCKLSSAPRALSSTLHCSPGFPLARRVSGP